LLDRDTNAALVVLKRGLAIAGPTIAKVGQDMPELKPVETRPLPFRVNRRDKPGRGGRNYMPRKGWNPTALAAGRKSLRCERRKHGLR
jgi:hypothetical protein